LRGTGRPQAAALFSVASVVGFVAGEVEGEPRPCQVELCGAPPPPPMALACARFFGGAVRHGVPRSRVVYERAGLERRLRGSDPALAEILEHAVRSRRAPAQPVAEALQQVLLTAGPAAAAGQAQAAAALGLSPRSLRRHLAEEGTSFQAVLDRVRQGWAEAWLAGPSTPVAAVADRLGYADAAAFRRAFRRWTGMSPAAWAGLMGAPGPG
jgi:AraC-like DNA-binding protein